VIERLRVAFERAPGLADRVAARAHDGDTDTLIAIARTELARMGEAERRSLLDAHPRIGADAAGLSADSRREQGADADANTARELAELNDAYERRFGFRFVVFVNGRPKQELVPVLRERLARTEAEELATGVEEFLAIARDRLARTPH